MDAAARFVDVDNFAVDGDEDGAVRRRGQFDEEVVRERVAVFEDDFGKDFAADTFLLPAGREFAAASTFFGEAGGKAFGFLAVGDVGGDDLFLGGAESDVDVAGGSVVVAVMGGAMRMDVNGGRFSGFAISISAAFAVAAFVFGEGGECGGNCEENGE